MANTITIIGNMTGDPELRYTNTGTPVANFTIACSERVFDRQSNEWKDGQTVFWRCAIWREAAEHLAASVKKGARVIAVGRVRQEEWTGEDGQKKQGMKIEVDEIGPSLRFEKAVQGQTGRGLRVVDNSAPF